MNMRTTRLWLFTALLMLSPLAQAENGLEAQLIRMDTSEGSIVLEIYPDKAPTTVANFLKYVDAGFFNNTLFHRVIDDFMIQGGGFTPEYERKQTQAPIMNEADNGMKNKRGTIAMARTFEPHSATAQFFINVKDNDFLDHVNKTPRGWGYCVFGKVVEGMDVVDKIKKVQTGAGGPFRQDVPQQPIIITQVTRLTAALPKPAAPAIAQ